MADGKDRLSPTDAGSCNGTALRKATRRVSQLYDAVLAPCGLRSTQRSILIHIARAGAPSMGELALALVLDRSALAHNLKPLERDGFVVIAADPNDRRSRRVALTASGEAKLEESLALWDDAQRRFETAFGPDRARDLRATLALIASSDFALAFEATGAADVAPR
ncbi:MAG TPA: MarR family winged helix-turn-helix transcriptional regulator [Aliidongia sp.]|uniref:MarR family winged helix-turn-helix transcriptional regulator n=1 Tax=Aliidongia sp. TaxID=1914230 RepID=UPI002DDD73D0|nr:MarR family winged helix-turn-helix transcriptional regulator [Aliidongia sp.]HEV2676139.1 MarR family winged helix-turn-helix transcriptional regulator [Aliidongia sp.]